MVLFSLATIASDEVRADLLGVHVERGDELDVAHVVVAELHVHEPGHAALRVGVPVVLHALDERRGAVADADDGYADANPCGAPSRCSRVVPGRRVRRSGRGRS